MTSEDDAADAADLERTLKRRGFRGHVEIRTEADMQYIDIRLAGPTWLIVARWLAFIPMRLWLRLTEIRHIKNLGG
jgi:hypothetical protein